MCVAVPCKVLQVSNGQAEVMYGGSPRRVQTPGFPDLVVGEYVTVHAGIVLNRLPEEDAQQILALFAELDGLMEVESD
jgi:hydrogenase expression/formation protein HypC